MANKLMVNIAVAMQSDGSSTSFSFDLAKSPYAINSGSGDNEDLDLIGEQKNWFIEDAAKSQPTGVITSYTAYGITITASLSGTVITLAFSAALAAGNYSIPVFLLF